MLGIVGDPAESFTGRAWLRRFPSGEVELLYKNGREPGELERLNEWLQDAGFPDRITRLAPPGYGTPRTERNDKETNDERSGRRAKQAVRWAVKAIGCDQMLTLTYRANVTEYVEAKKHFQKFAALCRREWPSWQFVAAPERQQRGAWHWHVGVKGFQNYDKLRGFWWRAMGYRVQWSAEGKPILRDTSETPGNVQGVSSKSRGRARRSWSADRMAGYLAKYVSKSLGAEHLDGKSYSVSRGLKWVTERYAVRSANFAGVAGSVFSLLSAAGVPLPYVWQAPDRTVLWAAGRALEPSG